MSADSDFEPMALPPGASTYDQWRGSHVEIRGWRDHLAILLKHRWIIIIMAAIGGGWGYWAASRVIPMYRATAVLRVAAGRQAAVNIQGFVPGVDGPDLPTELELLRSRGMASVVVDSLHFTVRTDSAVWEVLTGISVQGSDTVTLDFSQDAYTALDASGAEIVRVSYGRPMILPNARFTAVGKPHGIDRAVLVLQNRASAIERVRGGLQPSVRGGTQIVDLSFTDADPRVAAAVVNVAARIYQEQSRENAQRRARARRSYISAQLGRADSAHGAARMALLDFQREIGVLGPRAQLEQWELGLLGLESERVRLIADRQVLGSILGRVNRDSVTDADLQALAYAPGMDNDMVRGHYSNYLAMKMEREVLTAGQFGEADTSPSVRRADLLAESAKQEIIKAAESVIGIIEMRIVAVQDYYVTQAQGRIGELPAEAAREAELARRVLASQQVVEELRGERLRAGIAEVGEVGYVDIVDLAQGSASPLRPAGPPKVVLGLLLGLALGVAGAFGIHRVDTTVKDREDAEATLGVSSLAVIPRTDTDKRLTHRVFGALLNGRKHHTRSQVLLPAEGLAATPVAEAFRSLRTSLIFSQATSDLKSIVITSPMPREGKTTTCGYLGAVFARQGARTLLIDSDLRKPRLHSLFKLERSPGLTDVLLGEAELRAGVRKTEIDNLYLLPAGRATSNPSEMLGSKRFLTLAEENRKEFDLVIWDSPPVLAFTDAAILGRAADGVILVLFSGTTERRAAQAASAQLRHAGAHILGAVVNGFDPGGGIQYEYAYGYYSSYYASQFTEGDS